MNEYIKKSEAVDVIVKYPYDIAGKTATAIKMIEDLPSADVVPKSEVENIITLNSQLEAQVFEQRKEIERLKKYNTDVAFKHYNDGKAEVASEIFAEIYERLLLSFPAQSFIDAPCTTHDRLFNMVAELKKKYTEIEVEN